jgi:signal transduction histidine kinase/CheY-like chemotaxis protein
MKALVLCITFSVLADPSSSSISTSQIKRFELSNIQDQNINQQLNYLSLAAGTPAPPQDQNKLNTWLNALPIHTKTQLLGDRYATAFELDNNSQQVNWFIHAYGSDVPGMQILAFTDNALVPLRTVGNGLNQQHQLAQGANLQIPLGQSTTVVILFTSQYSLAPLKIQLTPQVTAEQRFFSDNLILLLSLGSGFALGLYGLCVYLTTLRREYLNFSLSTLAFTLGWMDVFAIPEAAGWGNLTLWLMPSFIWGSIFLCLFIVQFLSLNERTPGLAKILKSMAIIGGLLLPVAFYSPDLARFLAPLVTSIVYIVGLYASIQYAAVDHLAPRYLLLALLCALLPSLLSITISLGGLADININLYLLATLSFAIYSGLLAMGLLKQASLSVSIKAQHTASLEKQLKSVSLALKDSNLKGHQSKIDLLDAKNAKARFFSAMSHEIRLPINAMVEYTQGILLGDIDKSEQERVTQIIFENANHVSQVLNGILDMGEEHSSSAQSVSTPLFSILAYIESLVGKRARDKGLAFHLDYQYPLPALIKTDPTALKQVLFNLTNNAIKYTQKGYIGLSVAVQNHRLQIIIKDSGEGLSMEDQETLFTPGNQVDNPINRRLGGLGLGLSLSQRMAKSLGGEITFSSHPRKGSSFTLDMPLNLVKDSTWINSVQEIWQSTPANLMQADSLPSFAGSHVLVVDNKLQNRELIALLLKKMHIQVIQVKNGKQALNAVFYQKLDLILLDIHMPDMDGSEVLKQIRAAGNNTPVIALSNNNIADQMAHYLRLGFADHLSKPLSRGETVSKLNQYLTPKSQTSNKVEQGDMLRLIKGYQQDLLVQMATIKQALLARDLVLIAELADKIVKSAGAFGFDLIGDKFANIVHSALQDDEIAVTYELPKVIALCEQVIDLPGVNIAQAIVLHYNNVERFLQAIYAYSEQAALVLPDLKMAIQEQQVNSALIHLYKLLPTAHDCALEGSLVALKQLEDLLKGGLFSAPKTAPLLDTIDQHMAQLQAVLRPNLLNEI